MSRTFFLTEIISSEKSNLEKCANYCLRPMRALFNGRTIEIANGRIVKNQGCDYDRKWYQVALAIIALIPGLIVGMVLKAFALLSSSVKKNHAHVALYLDLKNSHKELEKQAAVINDLEDVAKITHFMQQASKEIDLLLKLLTLEAPDAMQQAKLLENQNGVIGTYSYSGEPQDPPYPYHDGGYCYKFFNASITQIYHFVRSLAFKEGKTASFFDGHSAESEWRMLYNNFCQKVNPFFPHMRDKRFANWSTEDHKAEQMLQADTTPTFYKFAHLMNGDPTNYTRFFIEGDASPELCQLLREDF